MKEVEECACIITSLREKEVDDVTNILLQRQANRRVGSRSMGTHIEL